MELCVSPICFNSKIKTVPPAISGRNLVPKGELPVLELTEEEKEIIAQLEKERATIQEEILNIIQKQANKYTAFKKNKYNYLMNILTYDENFITKMIKDIKKNRYGIQLEQFKKTHK